MTIALALALTVLQGDPVERELIRLEERLAAAWKAGDCEAWGAMLAADWSVTHITGALVRKAEALAMCRAADPPIAALDLSDLAVRIFGEAAVVTGRTKATTGGTGPVTVTLRFTDVFIRRAGRWEVVASHATQIVP